MNRYEAVMEAPEEEFSSWCVKRGEFYVCTVHLLGDSPRNPQQTAELIARLLNEEEEKNKGIMRVVSRKPDTNLEWDR